MAILKAENLSLKRGSKYIIKDIDWEIQKGENWVLFGLNGCGKTTLLSILSGYQSGNQGNNYIYDQCVDEDNFIDLRQSVGFVSGSFFDKYLSEEIVSEIVLAGKYGTLGFQNEEPTDADIRRANGLLRKFDLEKRARYPYNTLSKGQQQKVLIARALMANPKILVLDEPCSGLDIFSREIFLHMIEELAAETDLSIIYVTHHTEEILPFFEKAALMRDGHIVEQGALQDVFNNKSLTKFFGMNANVIWTEQHFFINLDFSKDYQSKHTFNVKTK